MPRTLSCGSRRRRRQPPARSGPGPSYHCWRMEKVSTFVATQPRPRPWTARSDCGAHRTAAKHGAGKDSWAPAQVGRVLWLQACCTLWMKRLLSFSAPEAVPRPVRSTAHRASNVGCSRETALGPPSNGLLSRGKAVTDFLTNDSPHHKPTEPTPQCQCHTKNNRRRPVLVGARRNVHRLDAGGVRLLHGHKVCGLCLKI